MIGAFDLFYPRDVIALKGHIFRLLFHWRTKAFQRHQSIFQSFSSWERIFNQKPGSNLPSMASTHVFSQRVLSKLYNNISFWPHDGKGKRKVVGISQNTAVIWSECSYKNIETSKGSSVLYFFLYFQQTYTVTGLQRLWDKRGIFPKKIYSLIVSTAVKLIDIEQNTQYVAKVLSPDSANLKFKMLFGNDAVISVRS